MASALDICRSHIKPDDHCLGCLGVDYRPVTLKDGRVVCTECPDYKREIIPTSG